MLPKEARSKFSAGLLMYVKKDGQFLYFLVHPGGPYWKNKKEGAWSIPKGEFFSDEDKFKAARREFLEETSIEPVGEFVELGFVKQKSGKTVYAWAFEGKEDYKFQCTSMVEMEYPAKSGKLLKFPEVDQCGLFNSQEAKKLINVAQKEFIERLEQLLK